MQDCALVKRVFLASFGGKWYTETYTKRGIFSMVITYHTAECFKISFGDTTIVCNPISKDSSLKQAKFGSDIVLQTLNHADMNGAESMSYGDRTPFVVSGPGEYEIKNVIIHGFPTVSHYGGVERINTAYIFSLENMKLCFLGALDEKKLPAEMKEQLDEIDLLFVPIGGEGVLSPDDAHELAVELEPRVIIPMHYGEIGVKNALALFLKEEGSEVPQTLDKLTIKRKDLETKNGEVIILQS